MDSIQKAILVVARYEFLRKFNAIDFQKFRNQLGEQGRNYYDAILKAKHKEINFILNSSQNQRFFQGKK